MGRKTLAVQAAAAVLGTASWGGAAAAQEAAPAATEFAVPRQPLGDALRAVALQSGRDLLVADELVAGREAPAVAGRMVPEEAVRRLLAGSGLRARVVEGTIIVERAGQAEERPAGAGSEPAETIVVTGTRLRGAPPTSPVVTITRREIDRAASASVEELVRKLPQNVSSGVGQENFGVTGAGADITDHGAGINLRGLGQRATLTLVNGRRLAPSGTGSFVDVSLIPVSAIERVEIVPDGASAIYGSDAVGGVVNFLLRRDFSGLEATVQAGSATKGDGDQLLAALAAGHRWSGGRALLAYEYRLEDEIRAADRPFTIGLPDYWFLTPRERRHSLYGSVGQDFGPDVRLELSAFGARRRTERSFVQGAGARETRQEARSRAAGGTAALTWRLGGSWEAEAGAGWSRTRTRQVSTDLAANTLFNRYDTANRAAELDLTVRGDLVRLPGGAAKLALGGQLRWEKFADLFESGVNEPSPTSGRRSVRSAFGELLVPVVGAANRRPGLERLLLTGAARLDRYSAYGTSIDPKVGALWSPLPGLALRTSYATSFRAPLLSESLGYYNAFLFQAGPLYQDLGTAPSGVGLVLVGSDPDVEPETSRSWTLGADWQPPARPGLSVSLTYYDIRFDNRIALPVTGVLGVIGDPALESIVTRSPDLGFTAGLLDGAGELLDFSGPGFTPGGAGPGDVVVILDARTSNTAATHTRGLDFIARQSWAHGPHQLRADLNINRVLKFTDRLTEDSPPLERLNSPFQPVKWRGRASLGWSRGPASATLFLNYVGAYRDRRTAEERRVDSWTTLDLSAAYEVGRLVGAEPDRLRFGVAAQNLLDADPPRLLPESGFVRDVGFDPVNASGRGRVVSMQLRARW